MTLLRTVEDLRWRVRDLEDRLTKPLDPRGHLPDLTEITKIYIQLFENKKHPPKQIGKMRSTIANQLLKLYVWTCPKKDIAQFAEGTCGNFYMPMYVPNTAYARKRIGGKLDYLGAEDAKLIGCLTNSKYSTRQQPDQAAMISETNHLWLHIRGELLRITAICARRRAGECRHLPLVLAGHPRLMPLGIGHDDEGIRHPLRSRNGWSSGQAIKVTQGESYIPPLWDILNSLTA